MAQLFWEKLQDMLETHAETDGIFSGLKHVTHTSGQLGETTDCKL